MSEVTPILSLRVRLQQCDYWCDGPHMIFMC